jgi:methylenetetrahydrofolate--tRNA-(uracil-5-)-methyltransferase
MSNNNNHDIIVIGGGLAGSEAAWQVAQRGKRVLLFEMRPQKMTPAHVSGKMAELVCSNSLGSVLIDRAPGLLKEEMRRLGSLIIEVAQRGKRVLLFEMRHFIEPFNC